MHIYANYYEKNVMLVKIHNEPHCRKDTLLLEARPLLWHKDEEAARLITSHSLVLLWWECLHVFFICKSEVNIKLLGLIIKFFLKIAYELFGISPNC